MIFNFIKSNEIRDLLTKITPKIQLIFAIKLITGKKQLEKWLIVDIHRNIKENFSFFQLQNSQYIRIGIPKARL